jgi:hypothetical protein
MKYNYPFWLLFFFLLACHPSKKISTTAQNKWKAIPIPLPPELSDPNKQFSGLYIYNGSLYLLPECRLQDKQEAVIYAIPLKELESTLHENHQPLSCTKYPIIGLQQLADKMKTTGEQYEGLEAIVISDRTVYLSVETTTPSPNCFLLKGMIKENALELDTSILTPVRKPEDESGNHIYNAGFEAMSLINDRLYCFFEYNYFNGYNYIYHYNNLLNPLSKDSVSMVKIPYRIADITMTGKTTGTAINFFYNGDGKDTIYRPLKEDSINYRLVHDSSGFRSYCRLLTVDIENDTITANPISDMPAAYIGYNWEGIASYKNGYFLINDKYTSARPYSTVLLYITPN